MTCASCAARVEKKLNRMDGVSATVNYATEKARVTFAGTVTTRLPRWPRPTSAWQWGPVPMWPSRAPISPSYAGDLRVAADAIQLSRRTLATIKGNPFWAFAYNVAALPLAAAGLLNPMLAGAAWQPEWMATGDATPSGPRRAGALNWWLRDRRTGAITVGQLPNPAIGVWLLATLFGWLDIFSDRAEEIRWVGAGALIAWAADELIRGANPARRLLGLGVVGWQIYRLVG